MVARDLLDSEHPLHDTFIKWLGDKTPTLRQARKFLAKFPQYRAAKPG